MDSFKTRLEEKERVLEQLKAMNDAENLDFVRNTRGFVLYFLMRKYTSVPYIGGISVRYK